MLRVKHKPNRSGPSLRVKAERFGKAAQLEVARLMVAARERGDKAEYDRHRNRLLYASIPWLIRLASRWSPDPHVVDDLIGAGVEGLIEGLDRFDPERDCTVGTYTRWWTRKAMLEYWRDQRGQIRVSRNAHDLKSMVDRGLIDPDSLTDGKRLQVDRADRAAQLSSQPHGCRFDPLASLIGREPDPSDQAEAAEDKAVLAALVLSIPCGAKRRAVIRRYGLDGRPAETFVEIAAREGITKQAAQQRAASGLDWVRERLCDLGLEG